ncbi:MAG: S8 family serine peptidase [Chitinophagaceae bacterium]
MKLGEEVELFEDPIPGETPAGTDDEHWLSDNLNRFVSRAGVALKGTYLAKKAQFLSDSFNKLLFDENDKENELKWKISWGNVDLEVWKIWKEFNTRGEGVKVAVIDTGALSGMNDLKGQINTNDSFSFISFDNTVDDRDTLLHGTKSCGVIGANGKNSNSVFGVAPACSLVIYQLYNRSETLAGYTIDNFCSALKKAREARVDVISMSFCTFQKNAALELEIKLCLQQNMLLIASVGDVSQSQGIVDAFPASIRGCFSIGAYKLDGQQRVILKEFSSQSTQLNCLAPGENILTCGPDHLPAMHQFTSASAPFVAGLFALIVSFRKRKGFPISHQIFFDKLPIACKKIEEGAQSDTKEGFGVLEAKTYFELFINE